MYITPLFIQQVFPAAREASRTRFLPKGWQFPGETYKHAGYCSSENDRLCLRDKLGRGHKIGLEA